MDYVRLSRKHELPATPKLATVGDRGVLGRDDVVGRPDWFNENTPEEL